MFSELIVLWSIDTRGIKNVQTDVCNRKLTNVKISRKSEIIYITLRISRINHSQNEVNLENPRFEELSFYLIRYKFTDDFDAPTWRFILICHFFFTCPLFFPMKIFQRSLANTIYKHTPTELRFNAPEMLRPYAISGALRTPDDPPARGRAFSPRAVCILL